MFYWEILMSLISKAEHEHLMRKKLDGSDLAGMFTGVACDRCSDGEYGYDSNAINATYPPSRWVKCNKCGHRTVITV